MDPTLLTMALAGFGKGRRHRFPPTFDQAIKLMSTSALTREQQRQRVARMRARCRLQRWFAGFEVGCLFDQSRQALLVTCEVSRLSVSGDRGHGLEGTEECTPTIWLWLSSLATWSVLACSRPWSNGPSPRRRPLRRAPAAFRASPPFWSA